MANSILETMQTIEAEAKAVLADYDAQIQALRAQSAEDLDKVKLDCDQETKLQVSKLEAVLTQQKTDLQASLAETMAKNDQHVRSVLSDKKAGLTQQIVDRVVEKYDN
ncbi:hypothetical protein ACVRWL_00325 [Streptococcus ratti]|uniref:V-type ATP synthase subunit G n=1 Tax=Streptococcus ratti TaxID=1341 RepID=A0A7X9LCY4_STRRT|nr:hypothetical protein [Streptococcus ratti]